MRACDAAKLARVLGLLGSEFAGERAAAALAAHRLMKRLGLTWQDLLVPRDAARHGLPPRREMLEAAESRLRQCERANDDLRRQMARLQRRLDIQLHHAPPAGPGEE